MEETHIRGSMQASGDRESTYHGWVSSIHGNRSQQPWMNRLHPRQSLTTPMDESPPSMDVVHDTNVGPHIIHGWNSSIHGKRSRHKCWNTLVRGRCAPIHRNRSRHKCWSSHHRWMDLSVCGRGASIRGRRKGPHLRSTISPANRPCLSIESPLPRRLHRRGERDAGHLHAADSKPPQPDPGAATVVSRKWLCALFDAMEARWRADATQAMRCHR
jgi:hypothetical protein